MTFSHRMATLAAVVLIPVGIAGTSYLLSDEPEKPSVPSEVELEDPRDGTPTGGDAESTAPPDGDASTGPSSDPSESHQPDESNEPHEEVVPAPSATEGPLGDEGDDTDDGNDNNDDTADDGNDGGDEDADDDG
ncbi:small secreted hydrophilic protein [Streptomyces sp. B6B3]|uniref:small secreted hydrophilic protein n=1 Tax=Streptomyces sp. B6B3 TaxID=3153570 RepID=UPI00325C4D1B